MSSQKSLSGALVFFARDPILFAYRENAENIEFLLSMGDAWVTQKNRLIAFSPCWFLAAGLY
jgi:hypothetical protein